MPASPALPSPLSVSIQAPSQMKWNVAKQTCFRMIFLNCSFIIIACFISNLILSMGGFIILSNLAMFFAVDLTNIHISKLQIFFNILTHLGYGIYIEYFEQISSTMLVIVCYFFLLIYRTKPFLNLHVWFSFYTIPRYMYLLVPLHWLLTISQN